MFVCDKCGCCCRHLNLSKAYASLDRGDGVCRYLTGNLCSIYESRPLLCRMDESYRAIFQFVMSRQDYDRLNAEECQRLKSMEE